MYRYKKIKLKDGSTMDEHRFIMERYLGRKLDTCEVVHHCNGSPRDNRLENLDIMLDSEHGRLHYNPDIANIISDEAKARLSEMNRGEGHSQSKLTDDLVRELKERFKTEKVPALSKEYGLSREILYQIRRGYRWSHVT